MSFLHINNGNMVETPTASFCYFKFELVKTFKLSMLNAFLPRKSPRFLLRPPCREEEEDFIFLVALKRKRQPQKWTNYRRNFSTWFSLKVAENVQNIFICFIYTHYNINSKMGKITNSSTSSSCNIISNNNDEHIYLMKEKQQ